MLERLRARLRLLYIEARHRWLDVRMGRCSGFRPCCIAWFVLVWRAGCNDIETPKWHDAYWAWIHAHRGQDWVGYVPCPRCVLAGHDMEARRCTSACGHHDECAALKAEWARALGWTDAEADTFMPGYASELSEEDQRELEEMMQLDGTTDPDALEMLDPGQAPGNYDGFLETCA